MPTKICRVCFEEGTDLKVLGIGSNSAGYKLSSSVPEINVYIVENPTICRPCLCMVEVAYKLRETCLENEKRFNQNFDRNDFVFSKKVPQIKKENSADKEHHENKEVSVVFNDYFDDSGVINIDSKEILKIEKPNDSYMSFNNYEKSVDHMLQVKMEVLDPTENLLEVSEEYITTESNDNFVSRMNSDGVPEYSCNMCDKTFSAVRYLKIHLNKMHYNVGVKKVKFECEICYRTFTTRGGLVMHSRSCKKIKYRISNTESNDVLVSSSIGVMEKDPLNSTSQNNDSQIGLDNSGSETSFQNSDTFTCEKCLKIFTTRASFRVHSKYCKEEFLDETKLKIDVSALTINPLSVADVMEAAPPNIAVNKVNEETADSHSDNNDGVDSDYDPSYKSSESPDPDSDGSDYSINNRRKRKSRGRNSWGFKSFSFSGEHYKRKRVDLQIKCERCSRTFATRAAITMHSKSCATLNMLPITTQHEESVTQNSEESDQQDTAIATEFINVDGTTDIKTENGVAVVGEFECKICEEKLPDSKTLEEHISNHIDLSSAAATNLVRASDDEITICCGKEYTTVSLLQLHTYKEHGKSCGVCNKHFSSYNELFAHLLEHTKE